VRLDGRRRAGVRITLIVAPDVGLLAWAHFAPALGDSFRKTYRRLLRWNDELPFVKFALAEDERIMLTAEVPAAVLDRDAVGRALARLVAVCDLLHEESSGFLGEWAAPKPVAPSALLERYAAEVAELEAPTTVEPGEPANAVEPAGEAANEPAVGAAVAGGGAAPEAVTES
jgi:hypothetical protein